MQRIRFHLFSTIGILCQEPAIFRIIEPGVIVVQPRLFIIHLSGIANLNVRSALSSADFVCYAVRFVGTAKALDKKALSKSSPARIVVFPNSSYV